MTDYVFGDKFHGNKNSQDGHHNTFIVNNSAPSRDELEAAIVELRAFIARLTSDGVVAPDGTVTDPAAVVQAVETQSGTIRTLGRAVAGGAKDAILTAVREGVAAVVVALVGR